MRAAYLNSLSAGADVDHRGTPFTQELLRLLLEALRDPTSGTASFGIARFEAAEFTGTADFDGAAFTGAARFDGAQFTGDAKFAGVQFAGDAGFKVAKFSGEAWFGVAKFSSNADFNKTEFASMAMFGGVEFFGEADFDSAQFSGDAWFERADFASNALFGGVQFTGEAWFGAVQFSADAVFDGAEFSDASRFGGAQISGNARFTMARFAGASLLGPFVCKNVVALWGAVFEAPVTLEIAAREVQCIRTRWESTALVRLRYATVDLSQAVLSAPVAITAHPSHFATLSILVVDESSLAYSSDGVRLSSIQGVDAAHLVLTDIDLTDCLFSGAFHLDQLRLEGRTTFAPVPTGWHRRGIWPARWTPRRTLAEEHHWRAQTASQPTPPPGHALSPRQWRPGPQHPDPALTPDPEDVAAVYRQIRKAFEDGKNEPGAADFYYGECEMRRHDRTGTPKGERRLLWGYWLLSGYGLRASRALWWLAAAMLTTILLLMGFGLPNDSPKQEATGTVPAGGGRVTFTIDKDDPHNPTGHRFTGTRFDKALNVTLNSVIFRSSGTDLTTAGTYIEMTSRLLEPTLLALAILAIRGRIKR
ncbi:pentapeptide repeat-containing protein [Streptomyces mirabilis]